MRRLLAGVLLGLGLAPSACTFTTASGFVECSTDLQCGSSKACSRGYCLPMPDSCRRLEGPFQEPNVVRFVALAPLTSGLDGGLNGLEQNGLNALALAVREVNGLTGLGGTPQRHFALYGCDTSHNDGVTAQQVTWATSEMQLAAMLISGNAATLLAATHPSRVDAGTLIVSPNATAEGLIAQFQKDHATFRTAPPDPLQASVLAQLLTGDPQYITQNRVAVVFETGDDRERFAAGLRSRLADAGRETVSFSYEPQVNAIELVARMSTFRPTASVLIGEPAQVRAILAESSRSPGLQRADGHRWLFSSGTKDPASLSATVATEADGMLGVAPSQGIGPLAADFRKRFLAAFGTEPGGASSSYDAMYVVMLAAGWANAHEGAITGPRLASALSTFSTDGGVRLLLTPDEWSNGLGAVGDQRPVSLEGITGPLGFDPDAGAPTTAFEVWRIADAGFATVRFATP